MIKIDQTVRNQFTEDIFNKAVELYVKSNADIILKLKDSEGEERGRIIHKLKGGAGMLGLIEISESLAQAEEEPVNIDINEKISEQFEEIKKFYKH